MYVCVCVCDDMYYHQQRLRKASGSATATRAMRRSGRSVFVPFLRRTTRTNCNARRDDGKVTTRLQARYPPGATALSRHRSHLPRFRYPVGEGGHVPQNRETLSVRKILTLTIAFCGHVPEHKEFSHPSLPKLTTKV